MPTSKTGRSRHVPLSRAALAVVAGLPRGEFLFPTPRDPSRHLATIEHGFRSAGAAAGLAGLRIHDLPHSAASARAGAGVDLYTVGKVLGHANVASTARYSHLANDALLAAVEAGAAMLDAAT